MKNIEKGFAVVFAALPSSWPFRTSDVGPRDTAFIGKTRAGRATRFT
jgi:hypothetical protein